MLFKLLYTAEKVAYMPIYDAFADVAAPEEVAIKVQFLKWFQSVKPFLIMYNYGIQCDRMQKVC